MQEKESIMTVQCKFKILSREITVRHHEASLMMPNSYPCDRIFNPHLTTIKDSYILTVTVQHQKACHVMPKSCHVMPKSYIQDGFYISTQNNYFLHSVPCTQFFIA